MRVYSIFAPLTVLNLIINGLPLIHFLETVQVEFNNIVLNLIINGLPLILYLWR